MKQRLSVRVPLLLSMFAVVAMMANFIIDWRGEQERIRKEAIKEIEMDVAPLRQLLGQAAVSGNFRLAAMPLELTALHPGMRHLLLLDEQGRVMLSNRPQDKPMIDELSTVYSQAVALAALRSGELSLSYDEMRPAILRGYFPVIVPGQLHHLLYLEYDISDALDEARHETIMRQILSSASMLALLGLLAAILHYSVTRRVRRLVETTERIASGDYTVRAGLEWEDEIARIGKALDQMTAKLQAEIVANEQAQQALRIADIAFETQEAILVTDRSANIVRVNHAFEQTTGYASNEVIGKNPRILRSGRQDQAFYQAMWETLHREGRWSGEVWDRRRNGEIYPKWLTINAVKRDGEVTHYVGVFVDISERKRSEEEIRNLAFYDPLTKLANRRLLFDRMKLALAQSERNENHGAVMFIDLDNFKVLNDTKGHEYGDRMLVDVARRIEACIRETDSAARFGGDEFVVLLEGLNAMQEEAINQAGRIAEKIRDSLSQVYELGGDETFESSPSIGVVLFRGQNLAIEELFKRADLAMYQAKESGRNQVRFFEPRMQAILESRTLMETALKHALENHEFELHFQLQTNDQRKLLGAEVLLRWRNPAIGLVPPAEFIPLAEKTKLIVPIGHWVLQQACIQLKSWESHPVFSQLCLAVNISPIQFHQPDFVEEVKSVLAATGANPARLDLELTENMVLDDIEDATAKMHALKQVGVHFSMDDFGTGYSSLQYIKRLPIDQLKIDQSFVRDILHDPNDAVMVQTIAGLAHNFGFSVIAEGVESQEQLPPLLDKGCDTFQGYLFSRPLPLEQFQKLVDEWKE